MFHCTTHARSTLLKCARDTSILGFADRAMSRISAPMFSPSLSQSVQMNSMLQRDAWCLMLSAIPSMFYPEPQQRRSRLRAKTHFGNRLLDRRIEQLARLHGLPVVVRRAKVVPHQMPRHAREHDAALAPRRTEDVVEAKVLDVRSGDIGLSGHVSSTFNQPCPTHSLDVPCEVADDGSRDGALLGDAQHSSDHPAFGVPAGSPCQSKLLVIVTGLA
jgi:hypothetical protein